MTCPADVIDEARAILEALVNNRLREHRAVVAEARERLAIIRLAADALKSCGPAEYAQMAEALYQEIEATCVWLAEKEASLNRPVGEAPADMTVH